MSRATERYGNLLESVLATQMDETSQRYGNLFESVQTTKDEWREVLAGEVNSFSERYGNLFRKYVKSQTRSFEELFTQMKRSTDTNISIEDCIAYLDAAKAKINELEAVGTYQATQVSKSIKSDFSELVEKMLKDKYFAIGDVNGKFAAFVFDSSVKRDSIVAANAQSNLAKGDFKEFVKQAKIGHKNICNYYNYDGVCLIFQT